MVKIVVLDASSTVKIKIQDLLFDMNSEQLDIELFDDGNDALDHIKENGADIIFSSIETEGLDGVSFVDILLREHPEYTSSLYVVTSQNSGDTFEEMKNVGAKKFIKKPINDEYFKHFIIPEIEKSLKKG